MFVFGLGRHVSMPPQKAGYSDSLFPTRSSECVHVDLDVELLYFEAN